jgi:hypothetical protein
MVKLENKKLMVVPLGGPRENTIRKVGVARLFCVVYKSVILGFNLVSKIMLGNSAVFR